jgi:hypothetical protein
MAVIAAVGDGSPLQAALPPGAGGSSAAAAPVTAVPATTPPRAPWTTVPPHARGTTLGPWKLRYQTVVLGPLSNQGLASVSQHGHEMLVFRGALSVPPVLAAQGWDHVGAPGAYDGDLFDAYQSAPDAPSKMFLVTKADGETEEFVHPLVPGEPSSNGFAAPSANGQWLISAGWGITDRLWMYPTPLLNKLASVATQPLPLVGTVDLDHTVSDLQGCATVSATRLLCTTADPTTNFWPGPNQLLQVDLFQPLGRGLPGQVGAHVSDLGSLPQLSSCQGAYEPEGLDYERSTEDLRIAVVPPVGCQLVTDIYDYRS